jgi:hypothetical protein
MKKVTILAIAIIFVAIASFVPAQTVVQSGRWGTSVDVSGYNLHANSGDRTMTIEINFKNPFEVKPDIILSVTRIDADKNTNQRYNVEVMSVSRDGFTIKVNTWSDSKIFSISGYWLAHAE